MTHTTQVLSDEQIIEIKKSAKALDPSKPWGDTLALARAIESATIKAVSGQEPVEWAVEYGAISLPQGHQSRITSWEVYATKEAAEAAARAMDFDSRILPVGSPPAQPAPVDEREAFEATMREKHGWGQTDFKCDKFGYCDGYTATAWIAWQARASLQCAQAPQPTKGQP